MQFISDINHKAFQHCKENNFPVFFMPVYSEFLKSSHDQLILAYSEETNVFMPVKVWKSQFLKFATCLYQPLNNEGALSIEQEKKFLDEFIESAKKQKLAHRISAPYNTAVFQTSPDNSISAPFGTYKVTLYPNSYENILSKFQARYRTAVRQADASDLTIEYGKKGLSDFYELHKITMNRSEMYVAPLSYFENYFDKMPNNVLLSVAYSGTEPIGALFLTYSPHSAQYLYGCSSDNIKASGAIKWLHADAMKNLIDKKVREYDFVGARLTELSAKLKGIQEFKSRFGTTLHKGVIWKKDLDEAKCVVYDALLKTKLLISKNKAPRDIIEQELEKINTLKFENKPDESKNKYDESFGNLKKKIGKDELIVCLQNAGIKKGDTVLVHSSLSKIGNVKGGATTVIESLLEAVGDEGNLAMPSFSYVDTMLNTTAEKDYLFNPKTTPSVVGLISETFRKLPEVKRSFHPTHSVCATGKNDQYIVDGHLTAESNFGLNTPFHRIMELNGKIVGLGIDIGHVTIYHMAEDLFPELFNGVYLPEPYPLKVATEKGMVSKKIRIHNPSHHIRRIDKTSAIEKWFTAHLKEKNILHENPFGSGKIWWMDIQQLMNELVDLKKHGISIYNVPVQN